jgi:hypothetical protein
MRNVGDNPLRFVEPAGLVQWVGTATEPALAAPVGSGGALIEARTKCVNGKRGYVKALGVGPALGLGGKLPKTPDSMPDGSRGSVVFEDYRPSVDPSSFNGPFESISLSAIVGTGGSIGITRCGNAFASGPGVAYGLGIGLTMIKGSCTVLESKIEDCCDDR